jgi:hypothetical protein
MNTLKRAAVVVGAATLVSMSALAAPAFASDISTCLTAYDNHQGSNIRVTYANNNCGGRNIRVKIIVSLGPDSGCHTMIAPPNIGSVWTWNYYVGFYDHLASC